MINLDCVDALSFLTGSNGSKYTKRITRAYICNFCSNGLLCGKYLRNLRTHLIKLVPTGSIFHKLISPGIDTSQGSDGSNISTDIKYTDKSIDFIDVDLTDSQTTLPYEPIDTCNDALRSNDPIDLDSTYCPEMVTTPLSSNGRQIQLEIQDSHTDLRACSTKIHHKSVNSSEFSDAFEIFRDFQLSAWGGSCT